MAAELKVLVVNRSDTDVLPGGDTIQMDMTIANLKRRNIRVSRRLAHEVTTRDWDVDIVHIFNLQMPEQVMSVLGEAKLRRLPVMLSPIYWDPLPGWFAQDENIQGAWRMLRSVVGYRLGLRIYRAWQLSRYPLSLAWLAKRQLLMQSAGLLPNAAAELEVLYKDFRLPQERIRHSYIIPNAIDMELYANVPAPSAHWRNVIGEDRFVLQVGRISPEKNNAALIKALWGVDIGIVFIGAASPHAPAYAELCRRLGARRGRVYFIERLPYDELPSIYALAAVHALPSWRETPGLVSMEAAAAGCPIVSTRIGSAVEYFGDDAWYCDPHSIRSIRNAVLSALSAPRNYKLRAHIMAGYTWEIAAQRTQSAYEQVLNMRDDAQVANILR